MPNTQNTFEENGMIASANRSDNVVQHLPVEIAQPVPMAQPVAAPVLHSKPKLDSDQDLYDGGWRLHVKNNVTCWKNKITGNTSYSRPHLNTLTTIICFCKQNPKLSFFLACMIFFVFPVWFNALRTL